MIRINNDLLSLTESLYNSGKYKKKLIRVEKAAKSKRIIAQGKITKHVYIIKEGIVKCSVHSKGNKNFILEFLGRGQIAGGIAVLQHSAVICNVEAITDMCLYKIDAGFYLSIIKSNKQFNRLLMETLASRLQHVGKHVAAQQLNMLEYSVQKIQVLFAKQDIKITKNDLADYLGVNRRSLNRVLKGISNDVLGGAVN